MIGKRLQEFRKKLGFTQKEFAKMFGVSEITMRRYEIGKVKPDIDFILELRNRFNLNINWLLTGEGEMFITEEEKKGEEKGRDYKREILEIIEKEDEEKVKALAEFLKRAWASKEQLSWEKSSEKRKTEKK